MLASIFRQSKARLLTAPYCTKTINEQTAIPSFQKKTSDPQTAVVMLNMGGPKSHEAVLPYLHRIMTDRDMIQLPYQSKLGPWIAHRRSEEVAKKYQEIGGGSPILEWTEKQGSLLMAALDCLSPSTAPHKHYVAFRYVPPFTEEAFTQMEVDGVSRCIIFSQYPQYSCATTGSSLNAIMDFYQNRKVPQHIKFSIIERWGTNQLLADVFAQRIREKLAKFKTRVKHDVLILFTAHSLPMKAVRRGDTYPSEIAATVANTMISLGTPNPHRLVWQSKVGPLPWLEPYTDKAIKAYAAQGHKNMILVPIAFVNEHIETLHELDIEYKELAEKAGVEQIERAAAPNDLPLFIDSMADVVTTHIRNNIPLSKQYLTRCAHCVNRRCGAARDFFSDFCSMDRDTIRTDKEYVK